MEHPTAMRKAISEVLETMFFVSVAFEHPDSGTRADHYRSKIMIFNDKESLNISFCMAEPFAKMIAANFLGDSEEEIAAEEVEDVMKELANMVGGNYMGQMEPENWQLGIPSLGNFEETPEGASHRLVLSFLGECVGEVVFRSGSPPMQL